MEHISINRTLHPNFRFFMIVMVITSLLLSIWLVSRKSELNGTLLASTIVTREQTPTQPLSARAKVQVNSLDVELENLLKEPNLTQKQKGFYSEIPKGTHLLGYSVHHDIVTVNLSKEFNEGAGATSAIQRVEEFKKVIHHVNPHYKLRIAVEGKPLTVVTSDGLELDQQKI